MINTDKLIICVAPCSSYPKDGTNPYIPVTPDEIAEEVYRAWNEGASLADIHAQTPEGNPTTNPDVIKDIIRRIRDKGCDIIVEFSPMVSLDQADKFEEGFRILEANPEMVSVGTQVHVFTHNKGEAVLLWTRSFIERLTRETVARGLKPEFFVFGIGGVVEVNILVEKISVPKPYWIDITVNIHGVAQNTMPYTPQNLMYVASLLPADSMFMTTGVGDAETPAAIQSILLGGHVRVGFEDNLYYSKGVLAKSNAELVQRIARIGIDLGREIASPTKARELLGIPQLK